MAQVRESNAPEKGPPVVDWGAVSYIGDGTEFFRAFRYVNRRHTLQDILRPGYWNPVPSSKRDQIVALQSWDEISFCVGGPEPFDATRGVLVIGKKPERPGNDLIVGLVSRDSTTPCRHAGEQEKPASSTDAKKEEKAA